MTPIEIRLSLDALHDELVAHRTLDPELRQSARHVLQDLARLLSSDEAADPHPTSDSLRDMLLEFEAEHPKLAQALGRIADGLQNLGI